MSPQSDSPPHDDEVIHLKLEGILPATEILAIHLTLRTISRLEHDRHPLHPSHPLILGEQQFTHKEFSLLFPLLSYYPDYVPHEVLYASVHSAHNARGYSSLTDQAVARARARLASAKAAGILTIETRLIANNLSRVRPRLRTLGLDYVPLLEMGYTLTPYRRPA